MECFGFGRAEQERAQLHDMLQGANANAEAFRKEAIRNKAAFDETSRKLERAQREIAELQHRLQATAQNEALLSNENNDLELKLAGLHAALDKAAMQQERDEERIRQAESQRDAAMAEARKLSKDREYLKHRVERMQKALSMLESVLDDTLRESHASDVQRGNAKAALRRSIEFCHSDSTGAAAGGGPKDVGPLMSSVHQQLQELMQQADSSSPSSHRTASPSRSSETATYSHSPRIRGTSSSRRGPDGLTGSYHTAAAPAAAAAGGGGLAAAGKPPVDTWRPPRDQRYSTRS